LWLALERPGDDIWFWTRQNAVQGNSVDEKVGFEVPFENGIAGCFNHNDNLIVYNPDEKSLSEVAENNGVQRKIDNENLQSILTDDDYVAVIETKNLNMVILQDSHVIVLSQNRDIIKIRHLISKMKYSQIHV
jgi:non-homologous end joining protein Ku